MLGGFTQHAYSSESARLSDAALFALSRFRQMLTSDAPRTISPRRTGPWFVFTDASHEPLAVPPLSGIGAALVDGNGQKVRFFAEQISEMVLKSINQTGRKVVIFECQFFAALCALVVWRDVITESNVVLYTDNGAVRDSVIACHTTSLDAMPILDSFLRLEGEIQCNIWVTRVPTESNIADNPARMQLTELLQSGCKRDRFQSDDFWKLQW